MKLRMEGSIFQMDEHKKRENTVLLLLEVARGGETIEGKPKAEKLGPKGATKKRRTSTIMNNRRLR